MIVRERMLNFLSKKWTFQELKDYELRNTHEIKGVTVR